jgi:hypothetical protein
MAKESWVITVSVRRVELAGSVDSAEGAWVGGVAEQAARVSRAKNRASLMGLGIVDLKRWKSKQIDRRVNEQRLDDQG